MSASSAIPSCSSYFLDGSHRKDHPSRHEEFLVVGVMEKIGSVLDRNQDKLHQWRRFPSSCACRAYNQPDYQREDQQART